MDGLSGVGLLFVLHLPALMVVFDCLENVDINMARVRAYELVPKSIRILELYVLRTKRLQHLNKFSISCRVY